MDQTETFEGHYHHVCVLLADSDHKSACKAQIGDQHVYDVAESELWWGPLAYFAIVIDPVTNVQLVLFLCTRKGHVDEVDRIHLDLGSLNLHMILLLMHGHYQWLGMVMTASTSLRHHQLCITNIVLLDLRYNLLLGATLPNIGDWRAPASGTFLSRSVSIGDSWVHEIHYVLLFQQLVGVFGRGQLGFALRNNPKLICLSHRENIVLTLLIAKLLHVVDLGPKLRAAYSFAWILGQCFGQELAHTWAYSRLWG